MLIMFKLDETTPEGQYYLTCARIRDISATSLFKRLVSTIGEDQLVSSVLDDNDTLKVRRKGEHSFEHSRSVLERRGA
jgi:hypothetical protein